MVRAESRHVLLRTGFGPESPLAPLAADDDGVRRTAIPQLGRLELVLGTGVDDAYLEANGESRPLPMGSYLDSKTGVFTWAPGVGYFGTYRLVFVRNGDQMTVEVTVGSRD